MSCHLEKKYIKCVPMLFIKCVPMLFSGFMIVMSPFRMNADFLAALICLILK